MDLCSGWRCPIPACLRRAHPDRARATATLIEVNFIRDHRADQMVERASALSLLAQAMYRPKATCMFAEMSVKKRPFRLWLGSCSAVDTTMLQDLGISGMICADARF